MRLIVALALLLALAPAARAAEVARDGDVSLRAAARHRELCLTVLHRAAIFGEVCDRPPYSAFRVLEVAGPDDSFGLAVAPSVAEVDVAGRRYATVSAEGFDARFAIVRARPGHILGLFDGAGSLIGADVSADPLETRRVAVARVGGARLLAYRSRQLVPDPLELDRVISQTCVDLVRHRASFGSCVDSGRGRIMVQLVPSCRSAPAVLGGVVPAAADRVAVVLGNGRQLRAGTHTLPARFGARAFALPVPAGQAIRSVIADGEQGEVIASRMVRHEPAGSLCPSPGSGTESYDDAASGARRPAGGVQVAASDGDQRLLVADARGPRGLCLGIDALPDRFPCGLLSPNPELATVFRQGGGVAAVLGPEVAYVDLRLAGGSVRRVPTTTGERYTGRYAGRVRFFVAGVPRGAVREAVLRDAAGHELTRDAVYAGDDPQVVGRGTLAGLRVTALRDPGIDETSPRSQLCAQLDGVRLGDLESIEPFLCEERRPDAPMVALAPCNRTRSALVGVIPRSARAIRVQLADGRTVRPLLAKLGRALLWIARPPRGARITGVRYRHRRVPLPLPPRSRQCGYAGFHALSG